MLQAQGIVSARRSLTLTNGKRIIVNNVSSNSEQSASSSKKRPRGEALNEDDPDVLLASDTFIPGLCPEGTDTG